MDYALAALGFVLLIGGAESLVRGATTVAEKCGVSTFLIGLTLVAFGTSLPELAASIQAAVIGAPDLAIGNIVGSNIANTLLILGAAAMVTPLAMPSHILKRDGGFVLICSLVFFAIALTMELDQSVGLAFLLVLVCYLFYAHRQDKFQYHLEATNSAPDASLSAANTSFDAKINRSLAWPVILSVVGLIALIFGGRLLVDSASNIARLWGVSDAVIGLTMLAIGTSFPELVTTMFAAFRKHTEMALGNILGSNIYNLLGIGGVMGLISPSRVPQEIVQFDIFVMIFSVVALLVCAFFSNRFTRGMGLVFLSAYAVYLYTI